MRYAILSYYDKELRLDGKDRQNIGDWIQVIAAEYILKELGIKDYIYIDRSEISLYEGEEVVLLFNGWNSFLETNTFKNKQFPMPDCITPVFFSYNLQGGYIPDFAHEQLKKFEPIGCRDEGTFNRLLNNGVDAYLTGCITALLPKRQENNNQNMTVFVDAPTELIGYVPKELMKNSKYLSNWFNIDRTDGKHIITHEEAKKSYSMAKKQLDYIKDNARIVITSRLHIASPCLAMGIPVIVAKDNVDDRFAWIDKYIPLYSKDDWDKINWNPMSVEYENEKKWMISRLKDILLTQKCSKDICDTFNTYYRNREKYDYNNLFIKELEKYEKKIESFNGYCICGVVSDVIVFQNVMDTMFKFLPFIGAYDNNILGEKRYKNSSIKPFDEMTYDRLNLYLITSKNAQKDIEDKLRENQCRYIVIDYKEGNWKTNILESI